MENLVSAGGVVMHGGKVLLLYKDQNGHHIGWMLPKGSVEMGETIPQAALREVYEEAGAIATIIKPLGETSYKFTSTQKGTRGRQCAKTVHWYLMTTDSTATIPQAEEFFIDAGFYKWNEARYLIKFKDEKKIIRKAFAEYDKLLKPERNM